MKVQDVVCRRAGEVQDVVKLSSAAQTWLWLLAMALMILDHTALAFGAGSLAGEVMRGFGRLAWPLYAFLLAYNVVVRQVEARRYYGPLLAGLVASQLPYMMLAGPRISIFGTLLLGLVVLDLARRRQITWWLLLLPLAPFVDYGVVGVLLPLALGVALARPGVISAGMVGLTILAQNWPSMFAPVALLAPLVVGLAVSLPPIGRLPKWFKYALYPGHLALLVLARTFIS